MDAVTIGALLKTGQKLVERFFPDPQARAEAMYKLEKLAQDGKAAELQAEVQLLLAQIEVNKVEASSDSLFKSGWRPAVGWVCVVGLFYTFLLRPLMIFALSLNEISAVPPALDMGDLLTLLMGLLGLAGMRTAEKFKGVASS